MTEENAQAESESFEQKSEATALGHKSPKSPRVSVC